MRNRALLFRLILSGFTVGVHAARADGAGDPTPTSSTDGEFSTSRAIQATISRMARSTGTPSLATACMAPIALFATAPTDSAPLMRPRLSIR